MGRILRAAAAAAVVIGSLPPHGAGASGPGRTAPWYVDQFGGERADLDAFYDGRLGVIKATAPAPMALISWRLLHGLAVGRSAGAALSVPCCGGPVLTVAAASDPWADARKLVPGAPALTRKDTEPDRPGPNFTRQPNCASSAFATAAATLRDRVGRYGAGSPDVAAWLAAQDQVFRSCSQPGLSLPPLPADAPAWLRADHAYQAAALDLYDGRAAQAAAGFAAIGRDPSSPWRSSSLYLQARALSREALAHRSAQSEAAASGAIAALASAPAGTFGQAQARTLSSVLAFHLEPEARMAELDAMLRRPAPPSDIAVQFRDYWNLSRAAQDRPPIADWIATLQAYTARSDIATSPAANPADLYARSRLAGLDHAVGRWRATGDRAWLIAALSLVDPGAPQASALVADGRAVPTGYPGWLTVQYHLARLTLASTPAAVMRPRLDAVLARQDLSVSDRNIFTALRLQVAAGPADFARLALRRRLCDDLNEEMYAPTAKGCVRASWEDDAEADGVFDGDHQHGTVGLGEDARAVIDRLPLADRMALSRSAVLPAKLRLDIALTSFGRAVQLQDDAALDTLARELSPLLPQLADDWRRIPLARPGPDKRFASFMVLAKIPGLRTDLIGDDYVGYTRPQGRVVEDFQRHWMDWIILPRGHGQPLPPPGLGLYQQDGFAPETDRLGRPASRTDLTCLGECGRGAAPLRLPDFAQALQKTAAAERAYFVKMPDTEDGPYDAAGVRVPPPPAPAGGVSAWNEMLAYARAYPDDPRIPQALHWIVHASRFGASHDQSGRRAFELLHRRYRRSAWALKTRVYAE